MSETNMTGEGSRTKKGGSRKINDKGMGSRRAGYGKWKV